MSNYKLVPVEPTDEMATAAMNAEIHANRVYGEPAAFSDIWNAMLAAAPDVQGEPVATIHVDGSFVHVSWRIPAPSRCAMDVYTAPQPAEQQPAPDVSGLVEALERARDRLESERRSGEWDPLIRDIDDALAAYRKGGE